jgi:hypothetical protein
MLTIILAFVAAAAIITSGLLYRNLRRRNWEYDMLSEDYTESLETNEQLRKNGRSATRVWSIESRRLRQQARDAERHAQDMQEFHLHNEQDLQHELSSIYGLVELLMLAVPKGGVIAHPHEVKRIFRPIIEAYPKQRMQADPVLESPETIKNANFF